MNVQALAERLASACNLPQGVALLWLHDPPDGPVSEVEGTLAATALRLRVDDAVAELWAEARRKKELATARG